MLDICCVDAFHSLTSLLSGILCDKSYFLKNVLRNADTSGPDNLKVQRTRGLSSLRECCEHLLLLTIVLESPA